MKYTRLFTFVGAIIDSPRSDSTYFPRNLEITPDFNKIAQLINSKGWEIESIKQTREAASRGKIDILEVLCTKEGNGSFQEEENYIYYLDKKRELSKSKIFY